MVLTQMCFCQPPTIVVVTRDQVNDFIALIKSLTYGPSKNKFPILLFGANRSLPVKRVNVISNVLSKNKYSKVQKMGSNIEDMISEFAGFYDYSSYFEAPEDGASRFILTIIPVNNISPENPAKVIDFHNLRSNIKDCIDFSDEADPEKEFTTVIAIVCDDPGAEISGASQACATRDWPEEILPNLLDSKFMILQETQNLVWFMFRNV